MRPERPFKSAGLAANHSEALFRERGAAVDLVPEFGRLGERLAREIEPVVGAFGGGRKGSEVRVAAVERMTGAALAEAIGPLAANCLLAIGGGKDRVLVSIDGAALLAQIDRAFGGTGEIGTKLPAALPLSADLLAQRVEQGFAQVLERLIEATEPLSVVERGSGCASLAAFRKGETLAVVTLERVEPGARPLTIRLAARTDGLAAILPTAATGRTAPARQASLLDSPFADIALTLEAVLTEMRLPLSSIAALAPGQTIPIAVARAVPLRVGGTIVARGTVGELDDRVAIQITNAIPSRKDVQ